MSLDNFDNIEIYEYEKKGTKLIVTTSQKKKLKIFNTKKNEEILLKKIEDHVRQNLHNTSPEDIKTVKEMTVAMGILTILTSILTIVEPSKMDGGMILAFISELLLFGPSAFIYCMDEYIKKCENKYSLFFRHKKEINEHVKANPMLLEDVNKKSREEIEDNLKNDNGIPAVNVNSIKKMKLKEMEELLEKMKFYQECNFETPQDIIENSNNIDELTEIYDSTETVKKKELIPENKRLQR